MPVFFDGFLSCVLTKLCFSLDFRAYLNLASVASQLDPGHKTSRIWDYRCTIEPTWIYNDAAAQSQMLMIVLNFAH